MGQGRPVMDGEFDDDFEAKLERMALGLEEEKKEESVSVPAENKVEIIEDKMQSASANLLIGDRNRKDIIELFVQKLLISLRKRGGGFAQLEGIVATVSLNCFMPKQQDKRE